MLYDKRWDAKVETADPFKIETLIAWLEKQPANEDYCYGHHGYCLLAQYFTAQGFKRVNVYSKYSPSGAHIRTLTGTYAYPDNWDDLVCRGPRTFGDALERFRLRAARNAI